MPPELPPLDHLWSALALCASDDFFVVARDLTVRHAGRPPEQPGILVERSLLHWLPAEHHDRARQLLDQAWDSPGPVEVELAGRSATDEPCWLLLRAVAVPQDDQNTVLLVCLRDTSQRHRAEAALRDSQQRQLFAQRLHEAQKLESLAVLAGGLAHDFNNLLTTVLGYADLAEWQLPSTSPLRNYMQHIAQAGRKAAGLCHQLLACAGKAPLTHEALDLAGLVRDMEPALRGLLAPAPLALELPAGTLALRGDAGLLRQALRELVSNAAEALAGRTGQVVVRLARRHLGREEMARLQRGSDRPAGDYALLEVADDGHGMDAATLARAFEPFFTTRFTGRGLGLAAVLGIVQAHRGAVDVCSEPARGTTVRLFLPLAVPAEVGLLVVLDDEPGTRLVLAHMLESAGFQVASAGSGADGLALVERIGERVRLVLFGLDWQRPGSATGLEQFRQRWPRLPLIAVGTDQEREQLPRLALLADGFLHRPFGMEELLHRVRSALPG